MEKYKISKATMQRYPIYLKALRMLKAMGNDCVMSNELATLTHIKSTTIRRDFSMIGKLGKQGYGYDVDDLIKIFSEELKVHCDEKIILVGVGNMGRALLKYNNWDYVVGEIVACFDKNPNQDIGVDIPLYDIKDIVEKKPKDCRIAIVAISGDVQATVDLLSEAGIVGIIDMTRDHYIKPKDMFVRQIDIVSKIQELVFEADYKMKG